MPLLTINLISTRRFLLSVPEGLDQTAQRHLVFGDNVIDDSVRAPFAQIDVSRRGTGGIGITDYRHHPALRVLSLYPSGRVIDRSFRLGSQNGTTRLEMNSDGFDWIEIVQPVNPIVGIVCS